MRKSQRKLLLTTATILLLHITSTKTTEMKPPTVMINILVRNKAHVLPYFLTNLERLDYPKNRIALWIQSDHNIDNSIKILELWISKVSNLYKSIRTTFDKSLKGYSDESGTAHWPKQRFNNVIQLRESALAFAREMWADYLLSLDADVFLTNPQVLTSLISKNLTISAPMLRSDGLYSNFWHGMTVDYYYERTEDYKPILYREKEKIGCFEVPMVHSCVLIDLRRVASDLFTYDHRNLLNYSGPVDDIITFAISVKEAGTEMHLCNDQVYGYIMVPLEQEDSLEQDYQQAVNLRLEIMTDDEPLMVDRKLFAAFLQKTPKTTLGLDKVFMINLKRRPDRRARMMNCFDELGLDVEVIDAVDGRNLNESFMESITFLPEYSDPYHQRPMTFGEIGCFMSHYGIWQRIVELGLKRTMVLEDDVRFEPYFNIKMRQLLDDMDQLPEWDLVYLGRKRLQENEEPWVSRHLVDVNYSYWTLGYVLSLRGARKLLEARPLDNLLPVDEFLPILFDKHPQLEWKLRYPRRNLIAFSVAPLLLYPTHYTGETGYISDTEDSKIIYSSKDEL